MKMLGIMLSLQAFKMFPGWSTTKKHYDRIMEINYRQHNLAT